MSNPDTEVQDDIPEPKLPPPTPKKQPGGDEVSRGAEQLAQEDDRSIYDWLQELGTIGAIRIKLARKYPKTDKLGNHIAGFLDEFDEPFTEREIKQRFGGGRFQAITYRMGRGGKFVYAGARTFEIEGNAVSPGGIDVPAPGARPTIADDELSGKALDHMARTAELSQRRAWALEDEVRRGGQKGLDPELLKLMNDPPGVRMLQSELVGLRQALAQKDSQILNLIAEGNRRPETPSVIEKTFEGLVAGESGRIEALRTQFDSELRTLRENHRSDIERERGRLEGELAQRERAHEREIAMVRETHAQAIRSVEQAYEARIDGLKGRLSDLERQLNEAKTEIGTLRAIKEKGPLDHVEEVVKLKNAMEVLGPAEPEPGSVWERIFQGVMQSPLAQAVAARVENTPPQQQVPPEIMRRRRAAAAARAAANGEAPQPGAVGPPVPTRKRPAAVPGQPQPIQLDPMEVAGAVAFIEQAVANQTDPKAFATSVRSMVPQAVLQALRTMGPDAFIDAARPPDGSVLYSQRGRNYVRQVVRALLGYEEEAAQPPAPTETPASGPASQTPSA